MSSDPRKMAGFAAFPDSVIAEIQRAADTGVYDIRGLGARRPVPSFDDLVFLGASMSRYPLEGYREACGTNVVLGSTVRKGDLLGTITDPMNNARTELRSPYAGRIIGMARNQVVMPGFAAFHVGIQTDETPVAESGDDDDAETRSDADDHLDSMSE